MVDEPEQETGELDQVDEDESSFDEPEPNPEPAEEQQTHNVTEEGLRDPETN